MGVCCSRNITLLHCCMHVLNAVGLQQGELGLPVLIVIGKSKNPIIGNN
jgi:hypothetical protein